MKFLTKFISILTIILLVTACGSERKRYVKSPIDNIITEYINVNNYSVILADMDYRENSNQYFHKYKIITEKSNSTETVEDDFNVKLTDWKQVSEITFDDYQKDLGMTILSKKNGVLDKKSTPAGYNNYVGNSKYGRWQTNSSGSSFWAFYGQYHFLSNMFYGPSYRYYRNDYDYYRRNYYGTSSYYGRRNNFGTSTYKNTSSTWSTKPRSFKQRVRNTVTKSASAKRSSGYSSSKSFGSSTKTTRNTSRYSSFGSSRGRSGGFGK